MRKPRVLDLFCGAGGMAMGLSRAGFEVVGVDVEEQPYYPFEFWQMDALDAWPHFADFDALHASPPCQAWTRARRFGRGRDDHPQLIEPTRELFARSGLPWSIENVAGTKGELRGTVRLCGSMFGLMVERHRYFELSHMAFQPPCDHKRWTKKVFPGTPRADGSRPLSRVVNPMASGISHDVFAESMGIDWMPATGFRPSRELHNAIPPAYGEWIGDHLMTEVRLANPGAGHERRGRHE